MFHINILSNDWILGNFWNSKNLLGQIFRGINMIWWMNGKCILQAEFVTTPLTMNQTGESKANITPKGKTTLRKANLFYSSYKARRSYLPPNGSWLKNELRADRISSKSLELGKFDEKLLFVLTRFVSALTCKFKICFDWSGTVCRKKTRVLLGYTVWVRK